MAASRIVLDLRPPTLSKRARRPGRNAGVGLHAAELQSCPSKQLHHRGGPPQRSGPTWRGPRLRAAPVCSPPPGLLVSLQVPNRGVRGQRSVAVVEAPAFPGTMAAFPACVFTRQPGQTLNTGATETDTRGAIDATVSGAAAARNTWEGDAPAPSCRPYELFHA